MPYSIGDELVYIADGYAHTGTVKDIILQVHYLIEPDEEADGRSFPVDRDSIFGRLRDFFYCPKCSSEMMYSDDYDVWLCPFCKIYKDPKIMKQLAKKEVENELRKRRQGFG